MRLPFFYGWAIVAIAFITMAFGVNARAACAWATPGRRSSCRTGSCAGAASP